MFEWLFYFDFFLVADIKIKEKPLKRQRRLGLEREWLENGQV